MEDRRSRAHSLADADPSRTGLLTGRPRGEECPSDSEFPGRMIRVRNADSGRRRTGEGPACSSEVDGGGAGLSPGPGYRLEWSRTSTRIDSDSSVGAES